MMVLVPVSTRGKATSLCIEGNDERRKPWENRTGFVKYSMIFVHWKVNGHCSNALRVGGKSSQCDVTL